MSEVALCLYRVHFYGINQQHTGKHEILCWTEHPFMELFSKQYGTANHLLSIYADLNIVSHHVVI